MRDLFGGQLLPGLAYREEIISPAEESSVIARVDAADLTPFRFQGWVGKRLTASFGWRYDFDDASFAPTEPLPAWLLALRDRAATFAGIGSDGLVQALLTRYDPGAGIGWHRDRSVFGDIVGISLGNPATLRFRRRRPGGFDRFSLAVAQRSVYHLRGEARRAWEHSIAPIAVPRWSITFRSLASYHGEAAPSP